MMLLTSVENVCPEVALFEPEFMPHNFIQSAYGNGSYYKESRRFEAEAKPYSECAEFSEYLFHKIGQLKIRGTTNQTKRKRLHISKTMKFEIFHRDDFCCYYCKRHKNELPKGIHLTLDHKIPHVEGGDDSFVNIVTACSDCNSGKSSKIINK
ncbi:MAG: HNH endonuclease [Candidatus Brocadiaceae bacterium]|nr:HNH endonuclease [Candidatus Brocadiaceae bacterium]